MDELIKKFLADFDLFLQEKIEKIVEGKMATLTSVDEDRVKELIEDRVVNLDDRMNEQDVRDIVRQMDFSIEIGRY